MGNQHWFIPNRDSVLAALQANAEQKIWAYRFDWDELPPPFDVVYGAAHAFDLPFVFGNFDPNHAAPGTTWRPWPSRVVFDADANAAPISVQ